MSSAVIVEPGRPDSLGDFVGSWTLLPNRSSVTVKTRTMWGLVAVRGTFGSVTGSGALDDDGAVRGTVSIAAASLDTGNDRRDAHLRSADFLAVESHPDVVLTVTGAIGTGLSGSGVTALVEGVLHVVGRTVEVSFPASVEFAGDNAFVDATLAVDRSAVGLTWNRLGMTSMDNVITAHLTFSRA